MGGGGGRGRVRGGERKTEEGDWGGGKGSELLPFYWTLLLVKTNLIILTTDINSKSLFGLN